MRVARRGLVLAVLAMFVGGADAAMAADLSAGLADAEQRASAASESIAQREQQLEAAEARYETSADKAAPLVRSLNRERANVSRLREDLVAEQDEAVARIAQLEDERAQEADDHDKDVRSGIGFGLAALVAAAIALAWGWFRATPPVAALTGIELGQAIGICVGGGLLLVIVGAVLGGSDGAIGALGSFLFTLGFILPTAFLLARHSAEVEQGNAKPLLGRERLPAWIPIAIAGLMFVLFLAGTGSAILADDASSEPISAELREEAEATSAGGGAEELEAAQAAVAKAEDRVAGPRAHRDAAQEALAEARGDLRSARRVLARAEASARSFSRRLVAAEAKEEREAERAATKAEQEEREEIEETEAELASQCHPSYTPCLDPNAYDYDCAGGSGDGPEYTGTVEVHGYDEYGLDDDGDGIGCE
jgi:hypothetical protein